MLYRGFLFLVLVLFVNLLNILDLIVLCFVVLMKWKVCYFFFFFLICIFLGGYIFNY